MLKVTKFGFRSQKYLGRPLRVALFLIFLFSPPLIFENGQALEMELGKGVTLDMDITVKYSGGIRVEDQDDDLLSDINGDDGNRNFDKGDLINNKLSVIADIDFNRDKIGFFIRPRAFYDFAYDGDKFLDKTQDRHRNDAEILDAFAYGTFNIGERLLDIRVGRQVVSWGESLFIQNGVASAQSYLDGTAANVPGVELKELYLPAGQVSTQVDIWKNFSLAGFYQWEWEKTRIDESGAYFSTADMLDDAGYRILAQAGIDAAIDRTADQKADDDGQYGVSLRYFAENLGDGMEFGFHFINYHEKTPMLKSQYGGGSLSATAQLLGGDWGNLPVPAAGGLPLSVVDPAAAATLNAVDTASYYLDYAEDIKLYGFSIGTNIGDTNVGCDITYRQDYPVAVPVSRMVNPLGMDYKEADVFQAQVSAIHNLGRGPFNLWDGLMFMGEVGFNRVLGMNDEALINDKFAWGGVGQLTFDYYSVLPNLDLKIPVTYKFNPEGNSSFGPSSFVENADSVGAGLDFTFKNIYQFGVSYTAFIGSSSDNSKTDRDFVGFYAKYTF